MRGTRPRARGCTTPARRARASPASAFEAPRAPRIWRPPRSWRAPPAVETLDAPGGGPRVRFTDPDGYPVEVVHGREPREPLPVARRRAAQLAAASASASAQLQRVAAGPGAVKRLGHAVLRVADFRTQRGLVPVALRLPALGRRLPRRARERGRGLPALRPRRRPRRSPHLPVRRRGRARLRPRRLRGRGLRRGDGRPRPPARRPATTTTTGVGRHILGSQVFDYWKDPWGHVVEHFTDGDLLDARGRARPPRSGARSLGTQWGEVRLMGLGSESDDTPTCRG